MHHLAFIEPVDYLVIGHLSQDLTEQGVQLGGTVSYAAKTAMALGLRVGIVTSMNPDTDISALDGAKISYTPSEYTSTFKNIYTPTGRIQYNYHTASRLDIHQVPEAWRNAQVVHLAPLMQEVEPGLARVFSNSLVGVTPQGYLREKDSQDRVHRCEWPEYRFVLENADAAVLSVEDVEGDESRIEEMASAARILVATEGAAGCRLFWNGDVRRFTPPLEKEIDPEIGRAHV